MIIKTPPPADLWDLPHFREERERCGANWLTRIADITDKYTFYIENKKSSNYKSNCPYNEGYYLAANGGAVRCSGCTTLLPGHMWYVMCDKDYTQCPFYNVENAEAKPEQMQLF